MPRKKIKKIFRFTPLNKNRNNMRGGKSMGNKYLTGFKDSDADGLPDLLEKKLGTDPEQADSDNDGVGDYEEYNIYGTDPLDSDTDKDGLPDGEEIKRGRNPKGSGLLKDLFIPHAGNDFQPKALHPYRLLFYALSSIILKTILIGAVIILPMEAWLTPDILVEQSQKIISLTNAIRKNLNIATLAESALLNQAAYNKAQDMLINQYFSHTGPGSKRLGDWLRQIKYSFAVAGENLAMGFASPEDVVNGWTRSATHYRNMVDPDFKEIGVGVTTGLYDNIDTTLVAEYFGAPIVQAAAPINETKPIKTVAAAPAINKPAALATSSEILGEKTDVKPAAVAAPVASPVEAPAPTPAEVPAEIIAEKPEIDQDRSKLYVDRPAGQNQMVVRAEVYLSNEAVKAQVNFNNYFINLNPAPEAVGKWVGQTIISKPDQEQIFNPVVLASITAEDRAGNKATVDLPWADIKPAATTKLQQYFFIKQHQPAYVKPLFDITSIYYKIILLMACLALGLNIFIQIKKQHPHLIISSLGLICLLAGLIIF